jgi:hypothetical protein
LFVFVFNFSSAAFLAAALSSIIFFLLSSAAFLFSSITFLRSSRFLAFSSACFFLIDSAASCFSLLVTSVVAVLFAKLELFLASFSAANFFLRSSNSFFFVSCNNLRSNISFSRASFFASNAFCLSMSSGFSLISSSLFSLSSSSFCCFLVSCYIF